MKLAIALSSLLLFAGLAFAGEGGDVTTCTSCTDIESSLTISNAWQLESGSTVGMPNGEYTYEFCAEGGATYEFTFCHDGGTANYDTDLSIWAEAGGRCGPVEEICNDDTCGLQSELVWTCNVGGQYVLRVAGFGSSQGSYTLAYRCQPCATPVEESTWGSIKNLFE